jgi:hypothetical protein
MQTSSSIHLILFTIAVSPPTLAGRVMLFSDPQANARGSQIFGKTVARGEHFHMVYFRVAMVGKLLSDGARTSVKQ